MIKQTLLLVIYLLTTLATAQAQTLESWTNTDIKNTILTYIKAVTDTKSKQYIEPKRRIAVFDNDGTLWNEKPTYIHFESIFHTLNEQQKISPNLSNREPWKIMASAKPDFNYYKQLFNIESFGLETIIEQLVGVPYVGYSSDEYEKMNTDFLNIWQHPKYKVGYKNLTYQPMIELIKLLEKHDFKVFIFTADEVDFLRPISQELYGIPPERVFGTSMLHTFTLDESGNTVFTRTTKPAWINNWANKAELIQRTFGNNVPVIAVGNSNGDEHMLRYTAINGGLSLWLHHTDSQREDKYNAHTDKLMALQKAGLIKEINMKKDWKTIFTQ